MSNQIFDDKSIPDFWSTGTVQHQEVDKFFAQFFKLSNARNPTYKGEGVDEAFADLFDPAKGTYQIASRKATGKKDIAALREELFTTIPNREHTVVRVYSLADDPLRYMVLGKVKYGHKAGHSTEGSWAAEVEFTQKGEDLKLSLYNVIMDTEPHH